MNLQLIISLSYEPILRLHEGSNQNCNEAKNKDMQVDYLDAVGHQKLHLLSTLKAHANHCMCRTPLILKLD